MRRVAGTTRFNRAWARCMNSNCPDHCMVFVMKEDSKGKDNSFMLGVDYNYCKGCLRCVDICPEDALTAEVETEHDVNELRADLRRVL